MHKITRITAGLFLLLCAAHAHAFCSVSWAYFDARTFGPALVRCSAAGDTITLWQQLDASGNPVWAHSTPAVSLDQTRLLSSLEWDNLDPTVFHTDHVPADKYVFVEFMANNQTVSLGTNALPFDVNFAGGIEVATGRGVDAATTTLLAWSRTSVAASTYEIGGMKSGTQRLARINGHEVLSSNFMTAVSAPSKCDCVDFTGPFTIVAGSGADQVYADARPGPTTLFANEGDDTFHVFGVDHLGSLTVDPGSGGANTAILGAGGNLFGIQGPLLFDGGNCTDALYVTMDDSGDAVSRQVGLSALPGSGKVAGLAPADIAFACDIPLGAWPSWLELRAGPKSDIFAVDGLFAQETHIVGGGGDDSVAFSLRHDGSSSGPLFVNNAGGSIGVDFDDRAGVVATDVELRKDYAYFTNHTTHERAAWVIWNTPGATDVAGVTLRLGKAANSVAIYGVPDDVDYFVYGGDGGMRVDLAGDKIGVGSSVALVGGAGQDVFTMTPTASGSGLISIDGGGQPAGCAAAGSACGDVLAYFGPVSGAVPTSGILQPPAGSGANSVFFASIENFDAIFAGCFEAAACQP